VIEKAGYVAVTSRQGADRRGDLVAPDRVSKNRRPAAALRVVLRCALTDPVFVECYLSEILWPGIQHPIESAGLFNTEPKHLSSVRARVAIGWVGTKAAAGLYATIDGDNTAWLHGVRVAEAYRNSGYGSALVRQACASLTAAPLDIKCYALTVRCDDSGRPFEQAFSTYGRCGFVPVGVPYPVTVSGLPCDRHLGNPGSQFLTLRMEARI
jgi:ribosomal protein S18 acetylase RimI-like enzyme